jgi:hypothetical protein
MRRDVKVKIDDNTLINILEAGFNNCWVMTFKPCELLKRLETGLYFQLCWAQVLLLEMYTEQ